MLKNFLEFYNIVSGLLVFEKMVKSYYKFNDILKYLKK